MDKWVFCSKMPAASGGIRESAQAGKGKISNGESSNLSVDKLGGFCLWERESLRIKYGLEGKYVLLQVARMKKEKNHQLSIRVLARIAREIKMVKLVLVGDGEEREQLMSLATQLGVADRVIMAGYQTPLEVSDWYAAGDLQLAPAYISEGCYVTPLEGLCVKQVSIAAKGSGVDEILEKEKIGIVAAPTVEEFSKQVVWATKHRKEVQEMGRRGQKWVKNNLTWDKYLEKFLQVS